MRDIVLTIAVAVALTRGFKHPWVSLMVWIVMSVLNPHRYTYGFAYQMPFALAAAAVVFIGLFITKDECRSAFNPSSNLLIALTLWMCITTMAAFFPAPSFGMLERVIKINLMVIIAYALIVNEKQIKIMTWVLTLSIGILSAKGGLFTVLSGGSHRVWGPPSSFVEDNNAFALAAVMVVPLLFFLAGEQTNKYYKRGLQAMAVLSVFSALGSQSRGALLALSAMTIFLVLKSKNKGWLLLGLLALVPVALMFMPESWYSRMSTVQTYDSDDSAMGRINAWHMAFNLAADRITGGGYAVANAYVFGLYAPNPLNPLTAHSIYFQMLGEHGWIGLLLYLSFWLYTWSSCNWVIERSRSIAEFGWVVNLARMLQVSMVAFAVGGAFLSLCYFDLPYYLAVLVYALRRYVSERLDSKARPQASPFLERSA
ncbi:MAG: putative O-glycosylation ligase, exosortase A system-associated [Paucibacter sp.]|nr:putative O-glycosylation ligase, exosortase A system-associated [Roseateles sp.]